MDGIRWITSFGDYIMDTVILFRPDVYKTYAEHIESSSAVGNFRIMGVLGGRWSLATAIPKKVLETYIENGKIYVPSRPDTDEKVEKYITRLKAEVIEEFSNLMIGVRDAIIMTFQQYRILQQTKEWRALDAS
jgi:hypothetical protein